MRSDRALALILMLLPGLAPAQDLGPPMSAIDWLSDSLTEPVAEPLGPAALEPPVDEGATVTDVVVTALDQEAGPRLDAIGLLPPAATGLPATLWGPSEATTLQRRIAEEQADVLPALQALLLKLLLAEVDPPRLGGGDGQSLFIARVDKLLDIGAVDQAYALLTLAGGTTPETLRRWFDAALLIGEEDEVCRAMAQAPDLSPTYPARIFCLARAGDWEGAVLLLANARALGEITAEEDALLARFLDPELFEGEPPLAPPLRVTPLTFRLFEAIGEPIPTATLPRAFGYADLRANIGWKAQIEAGERVARSGAVSDGQLLELYTRQAPAASGGVWDRVQIVQALEAALVDADEDALAAILPELWDILTRAETEAPMARIHGQELAAMDLPGAAGSVALRMGLLCERYELVSLEAEPRDGTERFLIGVAQGNVAGLPVGSEEERAVADGFASKGIPARFSDLIAQERLGEAILSAVTLFADGVQGDYDQVSDAIGLFRAIGLEDTARRAALEFLILDRRG